MRLKPRLILGSSSPRRLDILTSIGLPPALVKAADIDETPLKTELPRLYAQRVARAKNTALADQFPDDYLLTADTTVAVGRRILSTPANRDEAEKMIRLLSGRNHRVYTGVTLRAPNGRTASRLVEARVKIKRLSESEIKAALDTNEWQGRAGAYSYVGHFARFIQSITGSSSAVLGLPAYETAQLLHGLGYTPHGPDQA